MALLMDCAQVFLRICKKSLYHAAPSGLNWIVPIRNQEEFATKVGEIRLKEKIMTFLRLVLCRHWLLAGVVVALCDMGFDSPRALAMQGESFGALINKGRSRDRYNPRYTKGLLVSSIQFGSGTDYDYEIYDQIRMDYYYDDEILFFLAIPNFEGDQITFGADYLLSRSAGNRTWVGFRLMPASPGLGPYVRGVYRLGRHSKIHYKGEVTVGDTRMLAIGSIGFHSYPFRKSKHTFIDIKAKLISEHLEVTRDNLKRSINAYALSADIGHGWARFANVKGLELFTSIGLGHSNLRYSTSDCLGRSCEFQGSDTDIRLVVGMLFQHLTP